MCGAITTMCTVDECAKFARYDTVCASCLKKAENKGEPTGVN